MFKGGFMQVLKNMTWFVKENKKSYIIGILALLSTYIFVPVSTFIIGQIIDGFRIGWMGKENFKYYIIALFASIILHYIAGYLWNYYIFRNAFLAEKESRSRILSKLLKQNPKFYYKNSTGSLMSKATHDVSNIGMLMGYGLMAFFEATVYPISLIMIMGITVSWRLTFYSILALPLMIVFAAKLGKILEERFRSIQRSMERLNESVLENITSIRVIKGFSTQEINKERFDEKAKSLFDAQMDQSRLSALFFPIGRIIPGITFVVALIVGERMMGQGSLSLGQMVSFFMYLNMLTWPMLAFGDLINVIQESSSSLRRIQEIYDYEEDFKEKDNLKEYQGGQDITFNQLSFTYPGEKQKALDNISFTIPAGQTIGIVGKIGSGKTTLVKQLLRFYNVEEDSLLFGGESAENFTRESIRDKIGYVPQQHILFSKSVTDNILFGKADASIDQVNEAIDFADFSKDLHTLVDGVDTLIGEKGVSISGGQKQRLSIARAIIKDPEILILDDSLSAVDALTEKNIVKNIQEQRVGKTTIIVAHRLSGLKHADHIIVLDQGRIVEEGTHEELLSNEGWYYDMVQTQKLGGQNG